MMTSKVVRCLTWLPILALLVVSGCARTPLRAAKEGKASQQESFTGKNIDAQNPDGDTALILALDKGDSETARRLIDQGAKVDLQNNNGDTALIFAAARGNTEIVGRLIKKRATLDIENKNGNTALIFAAASGSTETVKKLIDKGATLDLQNSTGDTALIAATASDHTDIVRMLIKKGAKLDLQTQNGNTAIMVAVANGNDGIVRLLIDKGARLDIRNKDGVTALEGAMKADKAPLVKMLQAAIAGPAVKTDRALSACPGMHLRPVPGLSVHDRGSCWHLLRQRRIKTSSNRLPGCVISTKGRKLSSQQMRFLAIARHDKSECSFKASRERML